MTLGNFALVFKVVQSVNWQYQLDAICLSPLDAWGACRYLYLLDPGS